MSAVTKKQAISRPMLGIVEGVALAAVVSVVGILLFALIVKTFGLSDAVIPPVNQVLKVVSILLGTWRAVHCGARGLVAGLIVGVAYIALGAGIYMLLEGALSPVSVLLTDAALGAASGGVSGVLLANLLKK